MIEAISNKEQIRNNQKKKKKFYKSVNKGIFIFLWDKMGTFGKHWFSEKLSNAIY